MTFSLTATRTDAHGSVAESKATRLTLDTSMAGRMDALNPIELLLASLAACMIKGIERVAPSLDFDYDSVTVALTAIRPATEPRIEEIAYRLEIGTTENDSRLNVLHKNLQKFGTIYNTVSAGTSVHGELVRK